MLFPAFSLQTSIRNTLLLRLVLVHQIKKGSDRKIPNRVRRKTGSEQPVKLKTIVMKKLFILSSAAFFLFGSNARSQEVRFGATAGATFSNFHTELGDE